MNQVAERCEALLDLEDARGILVQKYQDQSITWRAMLTLMNAAAILRVQQLEMANWNYAVEDRYVGV